MTSKHVIFFNTKVTKIERSAFFGTPGIQNYLNDRLAERYSNNRSRSSLQHLTSVRQRFSTSTASSFVISVGEVRKYSIAYVFNEPLF